MTCQVIIESPQGSVKARALLDSASSSSFVSERIAQSLHLHRQSQNAKICGIAGLTHGNAAQALTSFKIHFVYSPSKRFDVSAIIVPHVTCNLPVCPIVWNHGWGHLNDLKLADPEFGKPGRVDVLLGVEIFVDVVRQGWRKGSHDSPAAIETEFGWVLAGNTRGSECNVITSHHVSVLSGDDILRQFWEVEEKPMADNTLTSEERSVLNHFRHNHSRNSEGRFVVPLPKRPEAGVLGESRAKAVRRFTSLEKFLHARNQFKDVEKVIEEYFINQDAEKVPLADLEMPPTPCLLFSNARGSQRI